MMIPHRKKTAKYRFPLIRSSILIIAFILVFFLFPEGLMAASLSDQQKGDLYSMICNMVNSSGTAHKGVYSLGDPIPVYEYINDTLEEEMNFRLYPVYSGDTLQFTAWELLENETFCGFQLAGYLAKYLSSYVDSGQEIAFIYDSDQCYLVTPDSAKVLFSFSHSVEERGTFDKSSDAHDLALECSISCTQLCLRDADPLRQYNETTDDTEISEHSAMEETSTDLAGQPSMEETDANLTGQSPLSQNNTDAAEQSAASSNGTPAFCVIAPCISRDMDETLPWIALMRRVRNGSSEKGLHLPL